MSPSGHGKALPFRDDIEREKQREAEKARLTQFRGIAAQLVGDKWTLEASDGRTRIVTRRSTGERELLCTVHADVLPHEYELITGAFDLLVLFLALQDRAAAKVRDLVAALDDRGKAERRKDFAAQAAMLCQSGSFQRFLGTKGGPVADKQAADTRLKGLLSITSKKQLNDDEAARKRFLSLRGDYDFWMKGGGQ
ncbi:hypothetical protein JNB71_03590 [Rhizobium herbae]|uniref:Uncharacterized protein n=1 Tax=Rhizobium herbae TaxID=508661 RepID=A0ABS7H5K6_9HYPH|nr:hypothetical protein [Rhizobium herbae]MBW9062395.1 hypothetical protein [Rhizobium herbae]